MRSAVLIAALAAMLSGCTFSRATVNDYVRDLDTSWIVPGRTTRTEIIDRLGMSPASREGGGVTAGSFRWVCADSFGTKLEAGYIVTPTFERTDRHFAEDILILFDERGVVELVSRTASRDGREIELKEWRE